MRISQLSRETLETKIHLRLNLDGNGRSKISTGIGFLDHMLHTLALHGMLDLEIQAQGDLSMGEHHLVEDVGIALGSALDRALGDRKGIARFGFALIPMDDALAMVALDLGGRGYLDFRIKFSQHAIGNFSLANSENLLRGFAQSGKLTLHIDSRGKDDHHKLEAVFKALGLSLNQAKQIYPERGIPSTKGII